jgi:LPXTG-motif cell wall-anchored protein
MKKKVKCFILVVSITFFIIGNNQIVFGTSIGEMYSKVSIRFDSTYIPSSDNENIPDGNVVVNSKDKIGMLPQTGEEKTMNEQLYGIGFIAIAFILLKKRKLENLLP